MSQPQGDSSSSGDAASSSQQQPSKPKAPAPVGGHTEYTSADLVASRWRLPSPSSSIIDLWKGAFPLRVYNSLTRSKVPFIPMRGRKVLWYMCGPTVYDSSHMGHARTYASFDVLRRLLSSSHSGSVGFSYDVTLTMNITDIDDKIIKRSQEAGVPFEQLARKYEQEFLADMARLGVLPPDCMTRVSEFVPEIVSFIEGIIARGYAYEANGSVYFSVESFRAAKDKAAASRHCYGKLVPENVGNKEALEEGEGVLTNAAAAAAAAAAGIGASLGAKDKRDGCDFALWKASKPGEPSWPSPWGLGRPGWHIECSAMCQSTLGALGGPATKGSIDIHSGGVDLRFPHHDNEIAQSEAFLESSQWTNYFLHTGHLNIEGLKMSKSLKNFLRIQQALERYGARALRLLFLCYRYNAPMDYSESVMEMVLSGVEKPLVEFFSNVKIALRACNAAERDSNSSGGARAKWGEKEHELAGQLEVCKEKVREALADDFDTPTVLDLLRGLIKDTNKYLAALSSMSLTAVPQLLRSVADYVTAVLRSFGLVDALPSIGFSLDTAGAANAAGGEAGAEGGSSGGVSKEDLLAPLLDVLAAFRVQVRDAARAKDPLKVLQACDHIRDVLLPPLGVVLEDAAPAPAAGSGGAGSGAPAAAAMWKLRDPAELKREAEEKQRKAEEKEREKAERAAAAAKREADKLAAASIKPGEMFKAPALADADKKYSAYDDEGVPTKDAEGKDLGEKAIKKLKKEWEKQKKDHEWYLAKISGGAGAGAGAGAAGSE